MPINFDPEQQTLANQPADIRRPEEGGPSLLDVGAAAFQLENVSLNLIQQAQQERETPDGEADFNPLDHLKPGEELVAGRFADATSQQEMQQIRDRVEREKQARQTLSQSGPFTSLIASGIGAAVDPINLIPLGAGARGVGIARSIGRGAVAGAGSNAAAEGALLATQETRTLDEAVANTLMGGALGAGFGAAGRGLAGARARRRSQEFQEALQEGTALTAAARQGDVNPQGLGRADAGAATTVSPSDFRLVAENTLSGLRTGLTALGFGSDALVPGSLRLGTSRFTATRRRLNELVDIGLLREGDVEGTIGSNAETRIRAREARSQSSLDQALEQNHQRLKQQVSRLDVDQRQFEQLVSQSMRRGDRNITGDTPGDFASRAAQEIRRDIINPLTNEAIRLGLLRQDLQTKFAESFFPRLFSQEAAQGNRTELVRRLQNSINNQLRVSDRQPGEDTSQAVRRGSREETTGEVSEEEVLEPGEQGIEPPGEGEDFAIRDEMGEEIRRIPAGGGDEEVRALAEAIADRIQGAPAGRLDEIGITIGERGSLAERTLPILDNDIEEFLESDARLAIGRFITQMSRDMEIARVARPEVEARAGDPNTPQALEADRQRQIEERMQEVRNRIDQQRRTRRNAKERFRRNLTENQRVARAEVKERIREQVDAEVTANQVTNRLDEDPRLTFSDRLPKWLNELGHTNAADAVRRVQPETELPERSASAADEITASNQRLAEAERELDELQQEAEPAPADNPLSRIQDQIAEEIQGEANQTSRSAGTSKEAQDIQQEARREIKMLSSMIDQLRGTDGVSNANPMMQNLVRVGRIARNFNVTRLMGSMVLSQFPDLGIVSLREGFGRTYGAAMREFASRAKFEGMENMSRAEAQRMGLIVAGQQANTLPARFMGEDAPLPISPNSKLDRAERATQRLSEATFQYSGATAWQNAMQSIGAQAAADSLGRTAQRIARGQEPGRRMRAKLGRAGLTDDMIQRVGNQIEEFAREDGGFLQPETGRWTDEGAKQAFRDAVVSDVNNAVLRPGQADVPMWMNKEYGKVLGQFRRFAASTVTRVIAQGTQQVSMGDFAPVAGGVISMLTLGAMSVMLRDIAIDGEITERDATQWGIEAFDRSGLGFALFELDALQSSATGFSLQSQLTGEEFQRFARRGALSEAGGPTVGVLEDAGPQGLQAITTAIGESDEGFTQKDAQSLRRLIPLQNHFALRTVIDQGIQAGFPVEDDG